HQAGRAVEDLRPAVRLHPAGLALLLVLDAAERGPLAAPAGQGRRLGAEALQLLGRLVPEMLADRRVDLPLDPAHELRRRGLAREGELRELDAEQPHP